MSGFNKWMIGFALAGLMLAGCMSGGGGIESLDAAPEGGNTQSLANGQTSMSAPAPQPQRVEVTRVVPVEVVKEVPVEVVREVVKEVPVYVEVTPQAPAINNFGMSAPVSECDTSQPYTVPLDNQDIAAGVVVRGAMQPCAYATAKAEGWMP